MTKLLITLAAMVFTVALGFFIYAAFFVIYVNYTFLKVIEVISYE